MRSRFLTLMAGGGHPPFTVKKRCGCSLVDAAQVKVGYLLVDPVTVLVIYYSYFQGVTLS